jgi:hypothetical protein
LLVVIDGSLCRPVGASGMRPVGSMIVSGTK